MIKQFQVNFGPNGITSYIYRNLKKLICCVDAPLGFSWKMEYHIYLENGAKYHDLSEFETHKDYLFSAGKAKNFHFHLFLVTITNFCIKLKSQLSYK